MMTFMLWYLAAVGALYLLVAIILVLRASARLRMALTVTILAAALGVGFALVPWFWRLLVASLIVGAMGDVLADRRARRRRLSRNSLDGRREQELRARAAHSALPTPHASFQGSRQA